MNVIQGLLLLAIMFTTTAVSADTECASRKFGKLRIVCVCNATYCDTIDPVPSLSQGQYTMYTSSADGLRFHKTTGIFSDATTSEREQAHFIINTSVVYQTIIGFGGAFTDSAGMNINSLSETVRLHLLRSYFSSEGIEYNMGRVPIAGTDFSSRVYTYDDIEGDITLAHFNLTYEDFIDKIPLIKNAVSIRKKPLKLVTAAWTAPPWTKTNHDYSGFGFLKEQYYQLWADYLVKFLDSYKEQGLEFWAISTGNEPSNGIIPINRFNSLGWSPYSQRKWIAENFGPAIRRSQHKNIKILVLDDQRFLLPWWIEIMLSNGQTAQYIDGIAVHWYWDTLLPAFLLDLTQSRFPDKFIISTEASYGDKPWQFTKVKLGAWERGQAYMDDILQNLNHGVRGWIDWNLALNPTGGPNWSKNFVDAAIIVNTTANEFYKNPMFYAIGHFSKFLAEGSVRISVEPQYKAGVDAVAFVTPDQVSVIVLQNRKSSVRYITINVPGQGKIDLKLDRWSFNTIIFNSNI